ncbi:MAG TPA: DUF5916 domain-containing protein [Kofleriaceae bacterium]|nr:DUF5916 domain-containing protein [Kofleriaceae bacterium]
MSRLLCLSLALASTFAAADTLPSSVRAHATRRTTPVAIDGKLDDAAWAGAEKQGGFTQRFPKDGDKPTQDTRFAVLYDDDALYVGVWCADTEPDKIRRTLTRRDVDALADIVVVGIDSYHDRRTGFAFQLNAAGVQRDMLLFDDSNQDDTWDAVWTGDVAMVTNGWTAEFRIPLNQLRFSGAESQEWGLQVVRAIARNQEQSAWSPWPRSAPAVVSKFGVIDGIEKVKPSRRLELLPYATGGLQTEPIEQGDPLNASSAALGNVGLDVKYGLGPAFTLSATLNPDFGQVEADPSQVNLGANELFFAEKRPFFLEGVDLFKIQVGTGDNFAEGVFYSRRIGAAPDAPDMDYDYIKQPTSTTIYSAAKLTGKTRGWSVGVLDAVTGEENAQIALGEQQMATVVSPLTNYAVARVKRDLREGHTSLGVSATAVNRALQDTPLVSTLHDQAYTAGAQLSHRWDDNAWELDIHGVGSWVHGSEDAIAITQSSNRHLFQRPDASHVAFDPKRTSLAGANMGWYFGRGGDTKHWRWDVGGDFRTPGLELNDAGFQLYADRNETWTWTEYRDEDPGKTMLNWRTSLITFMQNTFEPQIVVYGFNADIGGQLANYWSMRGAINVQGAGNDPIEMRGGPALRTDPRYALHLTANSDSRKKVRVDLDFAAERKPETDYMLVRVDTGLFVQARSNIDVSIGPTWTEATDPLQYVDQIDDTAGMTHYLFGRIRLTTVSLTTRMNWTFSPKLSLQVYAQPFVAVGSYSEYKDVDNPHADRFEDRFKPITGGESFTFDKPDFNFGQLRSTMVLRWEYRPGSALFAIWSHGQTADGTGLFDLGNDLATLARSASENIVMVKANYWIGL